jgi:hypothetical protein
MIRQIKSEIKIWLIKKKCWPKTEEVFIITYKYHKTRQKNSLFYSNIKIPKLFIVQSCCEEIKISYNVLGKEELIRTHKKMTKQYNKIYTNPNKSQLIICLSAHKKWIWINKMENLNS